MDIDDMSAQQRFLFEIDDCLSRIDIPAAMKAFQKGRPKRLSPPPEWPPMNDQQRWELGM